MYDKQGGSKLKNPSVMLPEGFSIANKRLFYHDLLGLHTLCGGQFQQINAFRQAAYIDGSVSRCACHAQLFDELAIYIHQLNARLFGVALPVNRYC